MAYNVLAAKRAGATDEQIARIIAQERGQSYDDLVAAGATPNQIIKIGNEQGFSFGEAFMAGARAEALSEIDGVKQIFGGELSAEQVAQENLARQAAEERGFATGLGQFVGGLVNPSTLLPGSFLLKGAKGVALAGAAGGGIAGAVRPIYTEEDLGRLGGAAIGATVGGALGFGLGKLIDQFGPKVADDILNTGAVSPDGKEITTPHFKLKIDENGNWTKEEAPVTDELIKARQLAEENRASTIEGLEPKVESPEVTATKAVEQEVLPVLPQYLSQRQPPTFAKSTIDFETDIDKALYIVGNPATKAGRDEYMAFLQQALKTDQGTITKLASEVRKEVIQAGKLAQGEAGLSGIGKIDKFRFNFSKSVDNILNPADKYLDDFSKKVYNLGAGLRTGPKGYPVFSFKQAEEAVSIMQRTDPTFVKSMPEASRNVAAYRRYLDDMKSLNGRNYKSKSFEDFITKGIDADDQIKMIEAGYFDGCR
jgi:hypothetical protein